MFTLDDVKIQDLKIHQDNRGHLIECWRSDEPIFTGMIEYSQMMYISWTLPGLKRGPHLHRQQSDLFTFPGPGLFVIYLWQFNEPSKQIKIEAGSDQPKTIYIPPGIVHGYKNIAMIPGLVINCPDELYKGIDKKAIEDIIRLEDDPNNPYVF